MDWREALNFHPAVTEWFQSTFDEPTLCQQAAWPAIQEGKHTLIAAPTGSGKTTSLATMIDYINTNLDRHIITVEDPRGSGIINRFSSTQVGITVIRD